MALYKYDTKDYDLDTIIKNAKAGLDDYISTHKVNESKFKDAVLDLLDQMRSGNSTSASNKAMTFNNNFAETRPDGLFRDRYKNNRHYTQGVGYLLKVMSNMSPYEEPKPEEKAKTKLSAKIIGQDILDKLGDVSTLNDTYKKKAQSDAWNYVLNKYKWDSPDLYELEGPHTLQELNTFLTEGINSFNTTDLNDDNYYYSRFGISSPFYKNPEVVTQPTILDQAKQQWIQNGFSEEECC